MVAVRSVHHLRQVCNPPCTWTYLVGVKLSLHRYHRLHCRGFHKHALPPLGTCYINLKYALEQLRTLARQRLTPAQRKRVWSWGKRDRCRQGRVKGGKVLEFAVALFVQLFAGVRVCEGVCIGGWGEVKLAVERLVDGGEEGFGAQLLGS